ALLRKNSIIGVSTLLTEEHPVRLSPEIGAKAKIAEPQSFKKGVVRPKLRVLSNSGLSQQCSQQQRTQPTVFSATVSSAKTNSATIACSGSLSLESADEIGLE
ncbi:hypothetical protein, partial [Paenibacillus algorifonticola]|uniref:hypothetical protein n=1 Tax=Paenibacillus algorifonticola TaxID=684063 RepID=UPI001E6211AB